MSPPIIPCQTEAASTYEEDARIPFILHEADQFFFCDRAHIEQYGKFLLYCSSQHFF